MDNNIERATDITSAQGDIYTRTALMLGDEAVARLKGASVLIFGLGGVGGYTAEALARAGVGRLGLVDMDRVAPSNLNRQIVATHDTVGMLKTEAAKARILSINPSARVDTYPVFYGGDGEGEPDIGDYGYAVDAIDTVSSKLTVIRRAKEAGVELISCMGTGNKLDPTRFRIDDISKTRECPLARAVRQGMKKQGLSGLTVLWSDEPPIHVGQRCPGSVSFVPSVAGLVIAGEMIKRIIGDNTPPRGE